MGSLHPSSRAARRARRAIVIGLLMWAGLLAAGRPAWAQPPEATLGPLSRAHASLEGKCSRCHGAEHSIIPSLCLSCHPAVQQRIRQKKGVHRDTADDCSGCHFEHQGLDAEIRPLDPASFDHRDDAGFRLEGRHAAIKTECARCHTTRSFLNVSPSCNSCHTDVHKGAMELPCASCHTQSSWQVASRAFHKTGRFRLEGRHLGASCTSCHLDWQIKGTPTTCYDCHWIRRQDDRYRTRLGTDCGSCHRPTSWTAVRWDHGANTGMALSGAHKAVGCEGCHKNQQFTRGDAACSSCHAADYQRAKDPNHGAAGFPMNCELCHRPSQTSWSQASFGHAAFPLSGAHATQACSACHKNNVYAGTTTSCVGCHRPDYERTSNPNHAEAGFPTACETCHRPTHTSWSQATFAHNTFYPLVGLHATQPCAACHKNGVYKGTPTDCLGCHRTDYDRTTSPNHAAAGFPTACETCHRASDSTWRASFDHNKFFVLQGIHATQACAACHKTGVYKGTPTACLGCHRTDYDRTTNPNHAAAGFPTTCGQCHAPSSSTWRSAFNHNSVFQLVGRHASAACASCHVNNVYKGTPRDCIGCHRTTYDRTSNPNHAAAGFPTTCDQCHSASGSSWSSSFNHSAIYPLLGRHLTAACSSCHKNNVYKGTARDCYPCHQANYNATTNPNHRGAGFPTTCDTCHRASDTAWNQGRFTHTWFPIASGRHAGRQCAECHQDPNNYKVFQCTTACHPRSQIDNEHKGRSGYVYESSACYSCHPTGRG
jgi:hypothetical protein